MSTTAKTGRRVRALTALGGAMLAFLLAASSAHGAAAWRIDVAANPTVAPGDQARYNVELVNIGDTAAPATLGGGSSNCVEGAPPPADPSKCIRLEMSFPPGLELVGFFQATPFDDPFTFTDCTIEDLTNSVSCVISGHNKGNQLGPIQRRGVDLLVEADPGADGQTLTANFQAGGGGGSSVSTVDATDITSAPPGFGFAAFDGLISDGPGGGGAFTQAGGHPYAAANSVENFSVGFNMVQVEQPREIVVELPPGFVGNPGALPRCTQEELANNAASIDDRPLCPAASQVGTTMVMSGSNTFGPVPVYSMVPPPGSAARFGFALLGTTVTLDARLREESGTYAVSIAAANVSQINLRRSDFTFWGVPGDESHRAERACPGQPHPGIGGPTCTSGDAPVAFLRNPTACTPTPDTGLTWRARSVSWDDPGEVKHASFVTHEPPAYPAAPQDSGPQAGITGCEKVPVKGSLQAKPTSREAETASGLGVRVEVPNPGLESPEAETSSSDLKKVRVTLPQGVTINPSQAEGLGVCTPAQFESSELSFHPTDKGCPEDSKIGTVEVVTPLLEEKIPGSVSVAQQDDPSTPTPGAENPFDSLLAIYVVLAEPERGILVKLAGKVETDESSGRIITTFDDLPQLPFSSFDFKFREGARAPLVTPPTCGTYATTTEIWGHSDPDGPPLISKSGFAIDRGIGGSPCPNGAPGFNPGFSAGTVNNNAGSFSPTLMRLTRLDGEQNLTKFSATLAPGLLAKLAGVENCSDAAIAAAKAPGRTGKEELASPSCPQGSKIGRTLAGAGVGSVLTHVPGSLHLAGPYKGAPLSVVSITPAVAGPFDVGVVVIREALSLDPVSGVASVDGAASDPIPHILKGIPLKLRDLRVYVDRESFTLNPTSCDPSQIGARLWGSAADVFNPADDVALDRAARFQAANCASLGFKPKLSLKLRGGSKRGAHPALRATYKPRPADANLQRTVVKLPRSAFLDQAHIRTICTRVQFAQGNCPKGAIYGKVTAFSPLLDEPLRGPAYLRSSDNQLPDLVFDLKGLVDIETSARIDSIRGGIRATFPFVPDAPLTKVVVEMQGGRKGLIQNSRNLCASTSRAEVKLDGHNGKASDSRPVVKPRCEKRGGGKR